MKHKQWVVFVLVISVVGFALWSSGTLHQWTTGLVEAEIEMYGIEATGVEFQ